MKVQLCDIKTIKDFSKLSFLSKDRQEQFAKFLKIEDKKTCYGAGLLLFELFGDKVNQIKKNECGKPYLENSNVFFNFSHSGDYVILASDEKEIGVDIEKNPNRSKRSDRAMFYKRRN